VIEILSMTASWVGLNDDGYLCLNGKGTRTKLRFYGSVVLSSTLVDIVLPLSMVLKLFRPRYTKIEPPIS